MHTLRKHIILCSDVRRVRCACGRKAVENSCPTRNATPRSPAFWAVAPLSYCERLQISRILGPELRPISFYLIIIFFAVVRVKMPSRTIRASLGTSTLRCAEVVSQTRSSVRPHVLPWKKISCTLVPTRNLILPIAVCKQPKLPSPSPSIRCEALLEGELLPSGRAIKPHFPSSSDDQ